ncbi:hypothetical protein RvY_09265 [Ramazzottius varieornatus]|uniref:Uncharacterized protein n=1 Tax=Ramazzottius varieornatus TaxID=947166 RepID=A0A1D1VHV8_RAMVA|nr:hypothetical protein RvY_09265 [Ramazzottius varieornatus]
MALTFSLLPLTTVGHLLATPPTTGMQRLQQITSWLQQETTSPHDKDDDSDEEDDDHDDKDISEENDDDDDDDEDKDNEEDEEDDEEERGNPPHGPANRGRQSEFRRPSSNLPYVVKKCAPASSAEIGMGVMAGTEQRDPKNNLKQDARKRWA